jgi:hypothetical protein
MDDQNCHITSPAASGPTVFERFISTIRPRNANLGLGTRILLGLEDERRLAEYKAKFLRELRARLYEDRLQEGFTQNKQSPALSLTRVNPRAGHSRRARRARRASRSPAAASDDPAPEPVQFLSFDPLDFTSESLIQIARYRGWHLCLQAHGYVNYDDGVPPWFIAEVKQHENDLRALLEVGFLAVAQ